MKMHVQSWIGDDTLATVAQWLAAVQGTEVMSISQLVEVALETMAESIVASGQRPVVEQEEIEEVFGAIALARMRTTRGSGRGKSRTRQRGTLPQLPQNEGGISKEDFSRALHVMDEIRKKNERARTMQEGEILASEAHDGEFSVEALKEEEGR